MEKLWPDSSRWLQDCHVQKEGVHGGSFTGNTAQTLLKKIDYLAQICPIQILPYVAVFRALEKVVSSCFGAELNVEYVQNISTFKDAFLALEIGVTPKIHTIIHHVPQFCQNTGTGLGKWSEQTSEAVHHDFSVTWSRFKINCLDHPNYGKKLLQAVCHYNSSHL